jgi:hypothetical protein
MRKQLGMRALQGSVCPYKLRPKGSGPPKLLNDRGEVNTVDTHEAFSVLGSRQKASTEYRFRRQVTSDVRKPRQHALMQNEELRWTIDPA